MRSMTRKRFTPAAVAFAPADKRHPGEGVRTTGIRASGQVDTRVDRQSPPAIFRRLRDRSRSGEHREKPLWRNW